MTETAIVPIDNLKEIAVSPGGLQFNTAAAMYAHCEIAARSGMVPDGLKGNPAACYIAASFGLTLGMDIDQALQNINVIKGKASLPGEMVAALIQRSHLCTYWDVGFDGDAGTDDFRAWVKTHRRGDDDTRLVEFTVRDAKRARLWEGNEVWKKYPRDMLLWKAISRMGKRFWSDVCRGLQVEEDMREVIDVIPTQGGGAGPAPPDAPDSALDLLGGGTTPGFTDSVDRTRGVTPGVVEFAGTAAHDQKIDEAAAKLVERDAANCPHSDSTMIDGYWVCHGCGLQLEKATAEEMNPANDLDDYVPPAMYDPTQNCPDCQRSPDIVETNGHAGGCSHRADEPAAAPAGGNT